MFVKLYSYKIKERNLPNWKRIQKEVRRVYKKHDDPMKWSTLFDRKKRFVNIIEISVYNSKRDFLKIKKNTDNDKDIGKLFNEFLNIVHRKKIVERGINLYV